MNREALVRNAKQFLNAMNYTQQYYSFAQNRTSNKAKKSFIGFVASWWLFIVHVAEKLSQLLRTEENINEIQPIMDKMIDLFKDDKICYDAVRDAKIDGTAGLRRQDPKTGLKMFLNLKKNIEDFFAVPKERASLDHNADISFEVVDDEIDVSQTELPKPYEENTVAEEREENRDEMEEREEFENEENMEEETEKENGEEIEKEKEVEEEKRIDKERGIVEEEQMESTVEMVEEKENEDEETADDEKEKEKVVAENRTPANAQNALCETRKKETEAANIRPNSEVLPPSVVDKSKTFEEKKKEYFDGILLCEKIGDRAFLEKFKNGEQLFFNNSDRIRVVYCEDEEDFENQRKDKPSDRIYLIKRLRRSEDNSGMYIPEDFKLDTAEEYLQMPMIQGNEEKIYDVYESITGKPERMTLHDLIGEMKNPVSEKVYNLLSLEFTGSGMKLEEEFHLPHIVKKESMVFKLEAALNARIKQLDEQLQERSQKNTTHLRRNRRKLQKQLNNMPSFHKFALLTMAGSFTDAHVDLGASSVFYHNREGQKVFYVAKNTEENIETFKKFVNDKSLPWIGSTLSDQWIRIVIEEGNTAILPSGFIHFVYTPKTSLVVGGNFLMTQDLPTHFEFNQLDEAGVKSKRLQKHNIFSNMRDVMLSYIEHVFIPQAKSMKEAGENLAMLDQTAKHFMDGLDSTALSKACPWYTKVEREAIMKDLETLFPEVKLQSKRAGNDKNETNNGRPSNKKQVVSSS